MIYIKAVSGRMPSFAVTENCAAGDRVVLAHGGEVGNSASVSRYGEIAVAVSVTSR